MADKVIDQFDIVPLTWVKGEIDLALDSVRDNIATLIANPTELSPLRFSKTHLYQITGAFDIVGLEGCKRFCFEIERLHNAFEKQTVPLNEENLALLREAIDVLSQYLQDLANGQPDLPFKLFPALERIMALQGEEAEESELFFIDTSARIPDNLLIQDQSVEPSQAEGDQPTTQVAQAAIEAGELPAYYGQQRHLFQRSLLKWLTGHSEVGLTGMRRAIENVQISQANPKQKALWWALSAFVDTLQQPAIAEKISAKKLCRRVDQQIRNLVEGNLRAPGNVLKDALYYVAISEPSTPKINQVKQTFELDSLLFKQRNAAQTQVKAHPNAALINGLVAKIEQLKGLWSLATEFTTLTERGALQSFHTHCSNMLTEIVQIENEHLVTLAKAIHQFSDMLLTTQGRFTYDASIEVAAGLTLLEDALNDYQRISVDFINRIDAQTKILANLVENEGELVGQLEARPLNSNVVPLALQQVKASLQKAEQLLEPYFLTSQQFDLLLPVNDLLQQVFGSLELLNLPLPSAIVSSCAKVVRGIYDQVIPPEPATLECIAASLTAIGVFLDEFAHPRAATATNLQTVLEQIGEKFPDHQVEVVLHLPDVATEVDPELLDVYIAEAEEVLAHLAEQLKKLRIHAGDEVALTELRRGYHTLKGSGRTIGLHDLGEVAWIVEQMLSTVIESKLTPNTAILDFIEARTADFAMWINQLGSSEVLQIDLPALTNEVAALMGQQNANPATAMVDEVVIGGTYKISRSLFNAFLEEANQHLKTIADDWLTVSEQLEGNAELIIKPNQEVQRAVHTLSSTAGAAGFKAIHQLANVFEYWLESHKGQWQSSHLSLYDSVISAIRAMLEKVSLYRQPRQAVGLLNVLNESIEQLRKGPSTKKKSIRHEMVQAVPDRELSHPEQGLQEQPLQAERPQQALVKKELAEVESTPEALSLKASAIEATPIAISQSTHDQAPRNNYLAAITADNFKEKTAASTLSLQAKSAVDDALLTLFLEEAKELVPSIGRDLIAWQKDPAQQQHLDALQRGLHTLKGSARIANQDVLGDAIHKMEGHLISATKGKVTPVDFNEIFSDWDHISGLLYQFEYQPAVEAVEQYALTSHKAERRTQFLRLRADLLERLMNDAGEISIARSRVEREMRGFKQSSTDLTDSVMRLNHQLREMEIEADSQLQSRMALLKDANEAFDPLEFDRYTRLQELTRMMAESVNDVVTIQHHLLQNLNVADSALAQQNRINRDLQHALMSIRMLPFSDIVERLQRTVRMTAREQGKNVELVLQGEQMEVDRSVLDKMGAPLEHLLRNAVAHGIEMPEYRSKTEKSEVGTILVQVSREHDEIVIRVKDDGAGINLQKVREQAIHQGLITDESNLSDSALMQIIFEAGFSTAQDVTQISGRGVGLDSVRSEISALGGRIDVSNNVGEGAIFTIYLPVTLSVSQAVMVRVGANIYALPSAMVLQVQKLKPKALIDGYQSKRVQWSGQDYPLYYLPRLLGDESQASESQLYTPVLLLRTGSYQIALHVDEVITNQEVVIKPLGKQMSRVPGMLGATVLSDGKIALILNPVQLANREDLAIGGVKTSHQVQKTEQSTAPVHTHAALPQVLVVDDSLTIRKVLSRLLEREGYQVILAKDGMDALQKLQEVIPEIILTDIEMPGMDGFELVRNIKADQRFLHVPLIMISSRTAQKHRQLAESLGVDLFLGKPVQEDVLIAQIANLIVRSKVTH